MKTTYKNNQLVKLAKRDNNFKRPYLLVNPLQGKHIPVQPKKALSIFTKLAEKTYDKYAKEKLLIIGFAETATAIGAAIACEFPNEVYYVHTTRESLKNKDYLFFSEVHSHAAEQKLIKNNIKEIIYQVDRIIFAEDEVTTGNTILNIIEVLQSEFKDKVLKFGITSILNGIPTERIETLKKNDIECTYLLKLSSENYISKLNNYTFTSDNMFKLETKTHFTPSITVMKGKADPRIGLTNKDYYKKCDSLATNILKAIDTESLKNKTVLVLGAEEFMFPALLFAHSIESLNYCTEVNFHATTRSPILPCNDSDYPLFSRYEIISLYNDKRKTFIYNLKSYDKVFILYDSETDSLMGLKTLITALKANNCNSIDIYKWGE